jgi:hypothetical protein
MYQGGVCSLPQNLWQRAIAMHIHTARGNHVHFCPAPWGRAARQDPAEVNDLRIFHAGALALRM